MRCSSPPPVWERACDPRRRPAPGHRGPPPRARLRRAPHARGRPAVIEFVFMLTRDDVTVPDALDVLGGLRASGLRYVGFKDVGPPPAVLAEVCGLAHECGMEVMLEVVSVSREDERRSLRAAREIG